MNINATPGQRVTKRQIELCLARADVAAKVKIQSPVGRKPQLSTVAYCMHEGDELDPSLKVIEEKCGRALGSARLAGVGADCARERMIAPEPKAALTNYEGSDKW